MKNRILTAFLAIFCVGVFSGCATQNSPQSLYYHGKGEFATALYEYFNETGDPYAQIASLENLIQVAYEKNLKVAPGIYSHLGLLYSNLGNLQKANFYFTKEVENFPESADFIAFLKSDKSKISKNKKAKK